MVISLEMTFLRCFFYNSLILLASAAISKYRHIARLLFMSFIISIANIVMLYINSIYIFNLVRLVIFCAFPAAAMGKVGLNKIMTVLSTGIIFCGSALIISQVTANIYLHFFLSSVIAFSACGLLPVVHNKIRVKKMTVKISRNGKRTISAFIDTGISCRQGLVVVLEKSLASSLLSEEELIEALRPENRAAVVTVGSCNSGISYVDISDLCVYIPKRKKILQARIMLTDSMLPYEALISAANELEASA